MYSLPSVQIKAPRADRVAIRARTGYGRWKNLVALTWNVGIAEKPIRESQVIEMRRAAPTAMAASIGTAGLLAIELHGIIGNGALSAWLGAMVLVNLVRLLRCRRMSVTEAAHNGIRLIGEATLIAGMSATLWLAPALFWTPLLTDEYRHVVGFVLMGVMAAGSTTLRSIPMAGLTFILLIGIGQVRISLFHDTWMVLGMTLILIGLLCGSLLAGSRLFIGNVRAMDELAEQGELISLLREFRSNGSDWLWEIDASLRMKFVSRTMVESLGRPLDELLGSKFRDVFDPDGRVQAMSHGARLLFQHFAEEQPFHEIVFPTVDGHRWYCLSGRPTFDEQGTLTGWQGVGSDITTLRTGSGTEGVRAARRDPLTGLANRLLVREMIEESMLRQLEIKGSCVLLLLDLDRFKLVNDTLGHAVGDRLLAKVARRLEAVCGPDAGVGRLGGDEFAVVWRGADDAVTLIDLSERIAAEVDRSFSIGPSAIHVGVSIGIARAPFDGDCEDAMMRCADLALYRAKEQGRGTSAFYEPWMLAKAQAERLLENDVRQAVRQGDLHLHYQPIVGASTRSIVGHEALLRWSHPTRGAIGPDVFVPIIEDVGLIHQIGDWVIREACNEAAKWPRGERVAVNISVAQLNGHGLRQTVEEALKDSGLAPERLELEVTETIFLGDDAATVAALHSLQALGVRLVLDDFGKGYSSFGYFTRASFAKIKIDQLYVRSAAAGQRDCIAIVQSILALASGLGVETTAEGVETHSQAEMMTALGCTQLQGYLFGKAVPASSIAADHAFRAQMDARRRA